MESFYVAVLIDENGKRSIDFNDSKDCGPLYILNFLNIMIDVYNVSEMVGVSSSYEIWKYENVYGGTLVAKSAEIK